MCLCVCVCVYVYHLYRCKTALCCRGVWHSCPTTRNEAVDMSGKGNVAGFLYLLYIYIYTYIVPPLGAYKSQLGGHIFYCCWFIWSTSTVIIHIYIYNVYSSCLFIGCVFARQMHSTNRIRNDSSEQVCVCVIIFTPFLSMDRLPIILAPVFWGLHLAESSSDQSNWNRLKKKFGVVSPYQHLL